MNFDEKIQQRLEELTGEQDLGHKTARIRWAGNVITLVQLITGDDSIHVKSLQELYSDYVTTGGRAFDNVKGSMLLE